MTTYLLRIFILFLVSTLAGCAIRSPQYQSTVSKGIESRTGYSLPDTKPLGHAIPDGVSLTDGLSEDEAVAIALWNNAAFQSDLTRLGFVRADLIEAGLLRNPVLSLLFPLGPKQLEFTVTWPLEQLWQRPRRVAVAKLDLEQVAENLVQNGLTLIRDVKVALRDLGHFRELARLADETLRVRRQIMEISESRLRAGDISELEANSFRVDVQRAEAESARLAHEILLAVDRTWALLGLEAEQRTGTFESPAARPGHKLPVPKDARELLTDALASRPELRAAELAIEAAGKRAGLERWKYFTLSGILDANAEGKSGFEAGPGLLGETPVLNQNQGGRARAAAELDRAARNYLAVRHRIILEVEDSHRKLVQARESHDYWGERIRPRLEEVVRITEKAYAGGEVSYLSVLEASRQLLDARLREIETAADVNRADAQLDWSLGRTRTRPR